MSPKQVRIARKAPVYKNQFLTIDEIHLQHELYSGAMTDEITRYNLDRGESVAVVMHNPADDSVILVEQFRYATYAHDGGWIWELPAGVIRPNETPEAAARREVMEEVGYQLNHLQAIHTFYPSPGITNERIFLFYCQVQPKDRIAIGGGALQETEDIKIFNVTFTEIKDKMTNGKLVDAKTLIGLQWLWISKSNN